MPPTPPEGATPNLPAALDVAAIRSGVAGRLIGTQVIYLPELPSTNTYATELAADGAAEGTVVTTDDQTAGRGRVGRTWLDLPRRQLALSVVLRPTFAPHYLVMASALAVADAIAQVADVAPLLKWPNDVLIGDRKACGILIETGSGAAVVGIGVNVNGSFATDPELASRAITLAEAAGCDVPREPLAVAILHELDGRYAALRDGGTGARRALLREWRDRLVTLGRRTTVRQRNATLHGTAEDVDESGALLLRLDDGTRRTIHWGDIE